MLRAGLIGLGTMGRHHARLLRSLDAFDFVELGKVFVGSIEDELRVMGNVLQSIFSTFFGRHFE